jgi:hypothetical protein
MEATTPTRPVCMFCQQPFQRQLVLWGRAGDVLVSFRESAALGRYAYGHEDCAASRRFPDEAARCSIRQLLNYEYSSRFDIELIRSMLPLAIVHRIHLEWHPAPSQTEKAAPQPTTSPREHEREGMVYVLHAQGTGRIKIGHSANFGVRLSTLQTASPYPLIVVKVIRTADHATLERHLHERFAAYRQHGEWFELPNDVLLSFLGELSTKEEALPAEKSQQYSPYVDKEGWLGCPECPCEHLETIGFEVRYRNSNTDHGFHAVGNMMNDDVAAVHIRSHLDEMPKEVIRSMQIVFQCTSCQHKFRMHIAGFIDGRTLCTWS